MVYIFKYGIVAFLIAEIIIENRKAYKVELPSGQLHTVYETEASLI